MGFWLHGPSCLPVWGNGIILLNSFPAENRELIFCLKVEGFDIWFLEGLQKDVKVGAILGWGPERILCNIQGALYALYQIHKSKIMNCDINSDNIMISTCLPHLNCLPIEACSPMVPEAQSSNAWHSPTLSTIP